MFSFDLYRWSSKIRPIGWNYSGISNEKQSYLCKCNEKSLSTLISSVGRLSNGGYRNLQRFKKWDCPTSLRFLCFVCCDLVLFPHLIISSMCNVRKLISVFDFLYLSFLRTDTELWFQWKYFRSISRRYESNASERQFWSGNRIYFQTTNSTIIWSQISSFGELCSIERDCF